MQPLTPQAIQVVQQRLQQQGVYSGQGAVAEVVEIA
jgi:hypothetical protein